MRNDSISVHLQVQDMILLGFTQGDCQYGERQVKVQLDWIGALAEHELEGTIIYMAQIGEVWVKESLPEVAAEMMAEYQKRQHAVNGMAFNNGAMRR